MNNIICKLKSLGKAGFFHVLIGGSFSKIIAFISSIVVVRLVTKDEYAFLAYADNIYSYVTLLCGLGSASAVLKFCVDENKNKSSAFLSFAFKFGTISQVIMMFILIFAINILPIAFPESEKYMYMLLFYPLLYFWIGLVQSYMRTQYKTKQYAYAGIMQVSITLICSIIFTFSWGIKGVISSRYIALIISIIYCCKTIKDDVIYKPEALSNEERKSFIKMALGLVVASVFSLIMPINESFLINNILADTNVTAEYKVANLIPSQLGFFTQAIIVYYFPVIAGMKDNEEIWQSIKKVGKITFIFIGVITFVGIIVSPIIIKFVYGKAYSNIDWLTTVLWIVNFSNAGFRMLPMNMLPAIGKVKFNVYISIISCLIHFILYYILICNLGIMGAILASCLVYILSGFAYWVYFRVVTKNKIVN